MPTQANFIPKLTSADLAFGSTITRTLDMQEFHNIKNHLQDRRTHAPPSAVKYCEFIFLVQRIPNMKD